MPKLIKQTVVQKTAMEKRNAAFAKLSLPEARVKIAEDVLVALMAKRFVARSTYFSITQNIRTLKEEAARKYTSAYYEPPALLVSGECQLSAVTLQVTCEVCGIGSLFVAAVERANNVSYDDMSSRTQRDYLVKYLDTWFTEDQLDLIEDYFENNFDNYMKNAPWFNTPKVKRMQMIMDNIISNNGMFLPWIGAHRIEFPPLVFHSLYFPNKDGQRACF